MVANTSVNGIVHGKTIELEQETGMPDGTRVQVAVVPRPTLPPGEGLRRSFGSWAGDDANLDEFLKQVRQSRDNDSRPDFTE
jgi:hypothetical protein